MYSSTFLIRKYFVSGIGSVYRLSIVYLQVVYGQELFDSVALRVYHLLEQHMQYKQYLDYLDLQPLSLGPGEARSEQDTKGEER